VSDRPAYGHARARILEVARERFAERGYRGTTTAELAEAAGVAEKTLFRHFPAKADLFREAVIAPFGAFVEAYLAGWEDRPPGIDVVDEVHGFFAGLLEALLANRDIVLAVEASRFSELQADLDGLLEQLERILEGQAAGRGYVFDAAIVARMMFELAVLAAFQPGEPDLDALANLVVYGVSGPR
jgi:AcrR family transcriptional regulator